MLNIERYKDKILKDDGIEQLDCILCDLRNGKCDDKTEDETYKECRKKTREWLFKEYKPIKMTKFEYDLIESCISSSSYRIKDLFNAWDVLMNLQRKGYFKNIDTKMSLHDIFVNAEVEDNATIN